MRGFVIIVVAVLTVAGCLGGGTDQNTEDEYNDSQQASMLPEPVEMPIDLPTCNVVEAFVPVDSTVVVPLLPSDFTPLLYGNQAMVVFGGLVCDGQSLQTSRAFLAISVETPVDSNLHSSGETNYFYEPEHILENNTEFNDVATQQHSMHIVSPRLDLSISATGASVSVEVPTGTHRMTTTGGAVIPAPYASAFGHFREYYAADGGYGYLDARFGTPTAGDFGAFPAIIQTAPDTPARTILGEEVTTIALVGSAWPYDDAILGFIPVPIPDTTA